MKEEVEKRIKLVKESIEPEDLKKNLCSFFMEGKCPDCLSCMQKDSDLDECKDYYLERIVRYPMEVWNEDFDKVVNQSRKLIGVSDVTGIGVSCDSCYMSDKCPLYKRGYACGIDWGDNKPTNSQAFMDFLLDTQYERVKRASVFEKIDGGVPDSNLSAEIDRLQNLIIGKENMGADRLSINVEASSKSGGGILAKLFGGSTQAIENNKPETIDITDSQGVEQKILADGKSES